MELTINGIKTHTKTVLTHRFWVCYYCHSVGLFWRGLTHDLSKFHPTEFIAGCKYANGIKSPIDIEKEMNNGVSMAWQHHKGRNSHHYEYWQDDFNDGTTHLVMPFEDTLEMLCDYLGAGRAYMKEKFSYEAELEWWRNKKPTLNAMHPVQIMFLDIAFTGLVKQNSMWTKKQYLKLYKLCQYTVANKDAEIVFEGE